MPTTVATVLVPAVAQFPGGAAADLCSLTDIKDELDIEKRDNDAWLRKRISWASEAIARFCNRTFQVQSYQEQFWPFRDSRPRKLDPDLASLSLSRWPIASPASPAGVAPPQVPVLYAVVGGALAFARYYARVTLVTAEGETAASVEASLAASAGHLPVVSAPDPDNEGLAIGWNCYLGTSASQETLQNASPLAFGADFTLPESGLVAGAALPDAVLVVENGMRPVPLCEGRDFIVDRESGALVRLHLVSHATRSWNSEPLLIEYRAGFATIPGDVEEAAMMLVKAAWFARSRDPMVREENIEGVYSATYWLGTGIGGEGDLPADVAARLDRYRVPVIA